MRKPSFWDAFRPMCPIPRLSHQYFRKLVFKTRINLSSLETVQPEARTTADHSISPRNKVQLLEVVYQIGIASTTLPVQRHRDTETPRHHKRRSNDVPSVISKHGRIALEQEALRQIPQIQNIQWTSMDTELIRMCTCRPRAVLVPSSC